MENQREFDLVIKDQKESEFLMKNKSDSEYILKSKSESEFVIPSKNSSRVNINEKMFSESDEISSQTSKSHSTNLPKIYSDLNEIYCQRREIETKSLLIYEENEKERKKLLLNKKRFNIMKYLFLSLVKLIINTTFQCIVSFFSCIIYVVNTYYHNFEYYTYFLVFDVVFTFFFVVDYAWNFSKAAHKKKFFFKTLNIIDLLTILPIVAVFIPPDSNEKLLTLYHFINFIRALRALRILRLYRLFISQDPSQTTSIFSFSVDTEIKGKIIFAISTILAMVFIGSGIIHSFHQMKIGFELSYLGEKIEELDFDQAAYFLVVAICTVGYGDMAPYSDSSRIFLVFFILLFIVLLTQQTYRLSTVIKIPQKYRAPPIKMSKDYVIICGTFSQKYLFKFLKELFHQNHLVRDEVKVLLLQKEPPKNEVLAVLKNPKYEKKLHYMAVNLFHPKRLEKVQLQGNKVFILSSGEDPTREDTFAMLASKSLRNIDSSLKIYAQLYENNLLLNPWADWDIALSFKMYKLGIIASNVYLKGFTTFISNLMFSVSKWQVKNLPEWVLQYLSGARQQVFVVSFENDRYCNFVKMRFDHAANLIYQNYEILLIGVRKKGLMNEFSKIETLINPLQYQIQAEDEGLFLAHSIKQIEILWQIRENILELSPVDLDLSKKVNDLLHFNFSTYHKISRNRNKLKHKYYKMNENDMRENLSNHILIFCNFIYLEELVASLSYFSKNDLICYVSQEPPDQNWEKIISRFKQIIYLECSYVSLNEISCTAIENAKHVILLSGLNLDSVVQDTEVLTLANVLRENYKNIPCTIELIDENNIKFLSKKKQAYQNKVPYHLWPEYAAGRVFFSATMDYILAHTYHNESIIDICGKLINSYYSPNYLSIEENNEVNCFEINEDFKEIEYGELFQHLVSRERTIIPIAIYKKTNQHKYLLTNPQKNLLLEKGDVLLVIGNVSQNSKQLIYPMVFKNYNNKNPFDFQPNIMPKLIPEHIKTFDNSDILQIAENIVKEDENIQKENENFVQQFTENKEIIDEYYSFKQTLIDQNIILKQLLNENENLRKKVNLKKRVFDILNPD